MPGMNDRNGQPMTWCGHSSALAMNGARRGTMVRVLGKIIYWTLLWGFSALAMGISMTMVRLIMRVP